MAKFVKIRIVKCETKKNSQNGNEFLSYKTLDPEKLGKLLDVKFTKACKNNVPESVCEIVVDRDNCNIDRNRLYPCVWVKKVEKILPVEMKAASFGEEYDPDKPTGNEKESDVTDEFVPF